MSAYIQDKAHIDALVRVAIHGPSDRSANLGSVSPDNAWHQPSWYVPGEDWRTGGRKAEHLTADRVGAMLWSTNVHSVAYRYPDDTSGTRPGPVPFEDADSLLYAYAPGRALTAVEALVALQGYEYQSCEHPEWPQSEAYAFCQALRACLISSLPGYNTATTWSIHDDASVTS